MRGAAIENVRCHLSGFMPADSERFGLLEAHRQSCLRCQAERARRRRLERQLRSLADVTVAAPAGLAARVMQSLESSPGITAAAVEPSGTWSWVYPAVAAAGCAMALAVARRTLSAA